MTQIELDTYSALETMEMGKKLSKNLPNGTTVLLTGDLGAGKTTLIRGVAQGLNIPDVVQSPTFNIMKIYLKGDRPLIHIDAYRLADIDTDIGLDEYIGYETGLTMIEWPNFISSLLPKENLEINITRTGDESRHFIIKSNSDALVEAVK